MSQLAINLKNDLDFFIFFMEHIHLPHIRDEHETSKLSPSCICAIFVCL